VRQQPEGLFARDMYVSIMTNPTAPSGPGRQFISTPSPVSGSTEGDEMVADKELMQSIKARKIASGAKKERGAR